MIVMQVLASLLIASCIYAIQPDLLKLKEEGDRYYREGDYKKAAEVYTKIWSQVGELSKEEKFRMAVAVSWGGMLKEAEAMLKDLKEKYPVDLNIRLHLARVLTWRGKNFEALKELDYILSRDPENVDALLVKGNALRWSGRPDRAIKLYEQVYAQRKDFDSGLALSYGYMELERRFEAKNIIEKLEPVYTYQSQELNEGKEVYLQKFEPQVSSGYTHYEDSDDNKVDTLNLRSVFWLNGYRLSPYYRHIWAEDNKRNKKAYEFGIELRNRLSENTLLFGSLGMSSTDSSGKLVGSVGLSIFAGRGSLNVSLNTNIMTYTAELLENRIRMTTFAISTFQNIDDNLYFNAIYQLRFFSDGNKGHFILLSPTYRLLHSNPAFRVGYRLTYSSYDKHKRMGYFDPKYYISNQVFFVFQYNKGKFYAYIEPFIGYQNYRRYGTTNNDIIGGGYASTGIKFSKNTQIAIDFEAGNYAMQTAAGWKYYQIGVALKHIF